MDERDIYRNVGKHRWPYVDEPRPEPPKRRPPDPAPVTREPGPRPIVGGEAVDAE